MNRLPRTAVPTAPRRVAVTAAALVGVALLAGCAASTPSFDAAFGRTVPQVMAQQVKDPAASTRNRDRPVDGIDGRAAREAMDRYYNSFRAPPPSGNTFVIGVGAATPGATPAPQ